MKPLRLFKPPVGHNRQFWKCHLQLWEIKTDIVHFFIDILRTNPLIGTSKKCRLRISHRSYPVSNLQPDTSKYPLWSPTAAKRPNATLTVSFRYPLRKSVHKTDRDRSEK